MFYSQRNIYKLEFLLYSKPSLLRQVVTNMLLKTCKRMMADVLKHIAKMKGNNSVDSHTSVLKICVFPSANHLNQSMRMGNRNTILSVHETIFNFKAHTCFRNVCFKCLSTTAGTVCGPFKQVRGQSSWVSLCHPTQ